MASKFLEIAFAQLGLLPQGIIHVGAHSGQEVNAYARHGIRHALFVEPQDCNFKKLQSEIIRTGNPNYHASKAVCWREDDATMDFYIASNDGLSSSLLYPTGHLEMHRDIEFSYREQLRTIKLDSLINRSPRNIHDGVDALVLDVQGAELDVLEGARRTLIQIRYIWIEVSWGGLYDGDSDLEHTIAFLRKLGFRMAYLAMTRWTWGNALFLNDKVISDFRVTPTG